MEKKERKEEEGREEAVPTLIMIDGNDTPHLSCYGLHHTRVEKEEKQERCEGGKGGGKAYTPMFRAMMQELRCRDCLGRTTDRRASH